jgi:putative transcriptional regulator
MFNQINNQMAKLKTTVHVERAKMRITQKELADAIGTTRQTICTIENGKTEPSMSLALRMAKFFKVDINELFKLE